MKKFLLFTFTMMLLCGSTAWGQNSVDVYGGTADPTTAMEGETVTLTATIPGGMTFNGWSHAFFLCIPYRGTDREKKIKFL